MRIAEDVSDELGEVRKQLGIKRWMFRPVRRGFVMDVQGVPKTESSLFVKVCESFLFLSQRATIGFFLVCLLGGLSAAPSRANRENIHTCFWGGHKFNGTFHCTQCSLLKKNIVLSVLFLDETAYYGTVLASAYRDRVCSRRPQSVVYLSTGISCSRVAKRFFA